jgi:hypothetical protein
MERLRASSNIEKQESLTNGLYRISGLWRSPIGGHLVVMQPVAIHAVFSNIRQVSYTNTSFAPRLVNLDASLIRGDTDFVGTVVEVELDEVPQITHYDFFKHLPVK